MIQKIAVSLRLKTGIGEKIMANNECRKLPVGIQSFNKIREEGYLYVDKTDMVWKLANQGLKYNFLSVLADLVSLCLLIHSRLTSKEEKSSSKD